MHHEYVNISFAHGWIHLWRIWKLLLLYQIKEYSVDWKGPLRDWTLTLRPLSWTLCNEQGYLQQDTKLFFPSISILIYLLLKYACTVNILLTTCMNSEHPCVGFTHNKMHFFCVWKTKIVMYECPLFFLLLPFTFISELMQCGMEYPSG